MGSRDAEHRFGGDWTTKKLHVLGGYLSGYTTALSKQNFRKAYIDAFAGTGYRTPPKGRHSGEPLLFPDLAEAGPQELLDGSARLALQTAPRFDRYIFIEQNARRCENLDALKTEFPHLASDMRVEKAEANAALREICRKTWSRHRAVVFLDPYGMQVEWGTIAAIAETKAIDLWILFPLGMGVNRMLTRDGDIPPGWRQSLDSLFGTTEWYDEFYKVVRQPSLLGGEEEQVVKASTETIGRYFNERLKSVFAGVSEQPAVLRNSRHSPLYLLCFAVGNERGKKIALRIADHLLKEVA